MHSDEHSSDWMRIKKFLAHVAKETGERLGWTQSDLHTADQQLTISFTNSPHDGNSTTHKESTCYSKLFHSDGWYRNDEQGTHFVSFGNGANYIPHGYPSIAATLFIVVGEARTIAVSRKQPKGTRRKKREVEPNDLLIQNRYHSGVLLFGLHDGTLAVADEHPFFSHTLALLQTHLDKYRRIIDYALPGIIVPHNQNILAVEEYQYHRSFVPILAEHLVTQVICATEGAAIREPIIRLVTSTQ